MHQLQVGQKVWYLPPNNNGNNRNKGQRLIETTITSIAKKYFYIEYDKRLKFEIETLDRYDPVYASGGSKIILSDVVYYQEQEFKEDWQTLRLKFSSVYKCPYTHDQVKRMLDIINESKP